MLVLAENLDTDCADKHEPHIEVVEGGALMEIVLVPLYVEIHRAKKGKKSLLVDT